MEDLRAGRRFSDLHLRATLSLVTSAAGDVPETLDAGRLSSIRKDFDYIVDRASLREEVINALAPCSSAERCNVEHDLASLVGDDAVAYCRYTLELSDEDVRRQLVAVYTSTVRDENIRREL